MKPSAWAQERFGDAAEEFLHAIPLAIYRAHKQALAAHIAGEINANDAYGNTLKVAHHEQLIECTAHIPGVATRKPADVRSRFDLVVLDETAVVLYPWRYAADGWTPRETVKLPKPLSELRRSLFTLTRRSVETQLSFDQIDDDPRDFADEQDVLDQLAEFGRLVTVAYASNPTGLFDLGIAEVDLVDEETGSVVWSHWEPLNRTAESLELRPALVSVTPTVAAGGGRFDDAPLDELVLAPRTAEPLHMAEKPKTGSDEM
ncbi:hypothetical protein ACWDUD_21805 [Rhodococcus sp. NPDC003382]